MGAQCMDVSVLKQDFFFALGFSYQAVSSYFKPLTEYPTKGWNLVFMLCNNNNRKKKREKKNERKQETRNYPGSELSWL